MKRYIQQIIEECLRDEVNVKQEWTKLRHSIAGEERSYGERKHFIQTIVRYTIAAVIGAFIALSVPYLLKQSKNEKAQLYTLSTGRGERSSLRLPDGTHILLNDCTTLSYSSEYGINNRDIQLSGEAYFEVAKNRELPFIVQANGIDVKALGTCFNVSAYKDDERVVTALFEGKVAVGQLKKHWYMTLAPDQVAIYDKNIKSLSVHPADSCSLVNWMDGELSFKRLPLHEVTRLLERRYPVIFQYTNTIKKDICLSGTFSSGESLDNILQVIHINTGIQFFAKKDTVVIQ